MDRYTLSDHIKSPTRTLVCMPEPQSKPIHEDDSSSSSSEEEIPRAPSLTPSIRSTKSVKPSDSKTVKSGRIEKPHKEDSIKKEKHKEIAKEVTKSHKTEQVTAKLAQLSIKDFSFPKEKEEDMSDETRSKGPEVFKGTGKDVERFITAYQMHFLLNVDKFKTD